VFFAALRTAAVSSRSSHRGRGRADDVDGHAHLVDHGVADRCDAPSRRRLLDVAVEWSAAGFRIQAGGAGGQAKVGGQCYDFVNIFINNFHTFQNNIMFLFIHIFIIIH
jgi:hypothetical protein